jgi:hypothetical protein
MMRRWLSMGTSLSDLFAAGFRNRQPKPSEDPVPHGDRDLAPPPDASPQLPLTTFTGTVVRHGTRFALLEATGILYALDSVGRAWSFEGEEVWVRGRLNPEVGLLHIEEIEPQAA